MASIIPGIEYDIFVGCRHTENAINGWGTEFGMKLCRELRTANSFYFFSETEMRLTL